MKANRDMLSVIIPVYNIEKYIEKCVRSVLAQTYADLEIILVDDGSADRSGDICEMLEKQESRIRVIHKENGGLSDARNAGLDAAVGEYISFIDGDDYIHPQMYEIMLDYLQKESADIVCCKFKRVTADENPPFVRLECKDIYAVLSAAEAMLNLQAVDVTACNKVYRRKIFENLRFPFGKYHEDEWIIHRILYGCGRIVAIDEELYYYVNRSDSITHTVSEKRFIDSIEGYMDRVHFVLENHWETVQEKTVISCLKYIMWSYAQKSNADRIWHCQVKKYYRKIAREASECGVKLDFSWHLFALSPRIYGLRNRCSSFMKRLWKKV